MVELHDEFSFPLDCKVPKMQIKKALKNEFYDSFEIKVSKNIDMMMEYLIDNFFWEFFHHFQEELGVRLGRENIKRFGGDII